jgi:hypothetical protein
MEGEKLGYNSGSSSREREGLRGVRKGHYTRPPKVIQ